jgi:hypothetical protein
MRGEHRPVIAGGTFAQCMALQILRGEIAKCGCVQPILSDLRWIGALCNGSDVNDGKLRACSRVIGP